MARTTENIHQFLLETTNTRAVAKTLKDESLIFFSFFSFPFFLSFSTFPRIHPFILFALLSFVHFIHTFSLTLSFYYHLTSLSSSRLYSSSSRLYSYLSFSYIQLKPPKKPNEELSGIVRYCFPLFSGACLESNDRSRPCSTQ